MKKIILPLVALSLLASCANNETKETKEAAEHGPR